MDGSMPRDFVGEEIGIGSDIVYMLNIDCYMFSLGYVSWYFWGGDKDCSTGV